MSKANMNSNPKFIQRKGYSSFSMDNVLKFTSTVGELIPVYYDILFPGDKVNLQTVVETKTRPLETNVMCRLVEHIDWFFVPMSQIYQPFKSWYFGIDDYQSSFFTENFSKNLPSLSRGEIGHDLYNWFHRGLPARSKYFNQSNVLSDDSGVAYVSPFDYMRLLDCFIPATSLVHQYSLDNAPSPSFSEAKTLIDYAIPPYLFCAYQKIYFDYYRLHDREPNDPACYSLDKYYSTGVVPKDVFWNKMCVMRYRAFRNDFFTNVKVSPLFGESSIGALPSAALNGVNQWLTGMTSVLTRKENGDVNTATPSSVTIPNQGVLTPSEVNPANMRTLFAAEKMLEITRRTAKNYEAQVLAHFGIKVPRGIDNNVIFIGKSMNTIDVNPIIATATVDGGSSLGQQGGYGIGRGQSPTLEFDAECHGILMAVHSVEPIIDYNDYGLDKLGMLSRREDWYTPEYENLGAQPLFYYQTNLEPANPWQTLIY